MTYVGLLITVAAVFVLPLPPIASVGLAIFGSLLTMLEGRSIYRLFAGALVAWSLFALLLTGPALRHAPDLQEPVPPPSGYGFKLDPGATNREHTYASQPIPAQGAASAAVEVVESYVKRLAPGWTVISRADVPRNVEVQLRQGDTSRGIQVSVSVFMPRGRPAVLVLHIHTILCGEDGPGVASGEVGCWAAPLARLVGYPDGGPVSNTPEPSAGPFREPVPLPPNYGFVPRNSTEEVHVYESTTAMSFHEANRAQRSVLRYYRRSLAQWTIVEQDRADLLLKAPDSTDGLAIDSTWTAMNGGGVVTLQIRAISCQTDYYCHWSPV
ncbi:MAG TPA: hypothetical protein VE646_01400 [Actinomycetota bacterium]|nr:hypothetical protein [Actinomycetota bacterium]